MRATAASLSVFLVTGLALNGCTSNGNGPVVVTTTTMLGSVVGDIVECGGGTEETLMSVGVDPHDFSASSQQVAHMAQAQLVVSNGLGLEEGLAAAIGSAEAEGARVMEVAPLVDPIPFGDGSTDPHFWHDVSRMAAAASLIGSKLAELTGVDAYADCGDKVHDTLMKTDREVRDILAVVPPEGRMLVTDHDAFGYFAAAYDFEIAGVVIPGGSTLAEPSSEALASLVDVIQAKGVPAIFSNIADSSPVTEAVAAEAGSEVEVVELFVGSLGAEGSGAETYSGTVLTNSRLIAEALG